MWAPVSSARLGAGWPRTPGRVRNGMSTNMPPAGWAGVPATMPATRIRIGPIGSIDVSWTIPEPSAAAAAGEAITGTTVAAVTGRVAVRRTERTDRDAGKGVSAVTSAYPAGSTAATVSWAPRGICHVVVHTAVLCRTPGIALIDFSTVGVMS